ncbi:helix-turn-helix transcriptional regulator [Corallococcus sp. ZKHCc1 1396]|uniref:Helix-turn-helix transcriptional regulator n=1 Tax=Corallococcus soli TaxID=2710757 RepID=A0ABR9PVZ3_9BACT|nr:MULTISPECIES: helix-turn-helix transcriptional regulator [Corallococcus]MBE4752100.1 helix-turn-helix transcriptional regulator [Corallococcus soli]MCY1030064.1 helix-turn-helix transcriptional regulator [Corallococcus sp. BB11-1]
MNEELAITVGTAARAARERQGLTQGDVASQVGIAMEVYSRMERGRVLPSSTTLRRLSMVLRIRADTLLGLDGPTPPQEALTMALADREEDPPTLRRLVRALRPLNEEELKALGLVIQGVLAFRAR